MKTLVLKGFYVLCTTNCLCGNNAHFYLFIFRLTTYYSDSKVIPLEIGYNQQSFQSYSVLRCR